ncbi:MAG: hypothetical protein ACKO15_12610, partial [Burkholderiales bacterium]
PVQNNCKHAAALVLRWVSSWRSADDGIGFASITAIDTRQPGVVKRASPSGIGTVTSSNGRAMTIHQRDMGCNVQASAFMPPLLNAGDGSIHGIYGLTPVVKSAEAWEKPDCESALMSMVRR